MENIINPFFEITLKDSLAIIKIKRDIFKLLKSKDDIDLLFNSLRLLHSDLTIKALLFINTPECYGEKAYDNFVKDSISLIKKDRFGEPVDFWNSNERYKENQILDNFVKYLSNYNKLSFTILSGEIVTPIFSASLATDIRYATPDMYFSLAHNKYGMHPSGGLPHFLIQQVGFNKAMELLFTERITAEKALELGLINKIVSIDKTLDLVINDIEKITKFPDYVIRRTKKLSNYVRNSLSDYFTYEASLWNL